LLPHGIQKIAIVDEDRYLHFGSAGEIASHGRRLAASSGKTKG
jgi:hypothetical protein